MDGRGPTKHTGVRRARATAAEVFGHTDLLPGQEQAMAAVLEGRDVLLVSPTGSGKSLAYQVPGVLMDGCTIVVSPLLALQRDQIEGLAEGDARTQGARLSSAESDTQQQEAIDRVRRGSTEFLFLAPEQLARPDRRRQLAELRPSLVAVDEAHCVSSWGHDFRPDYFRLGELIDDLGHPPVIALTATAAPPVREDIVERLHLRDVRSIVTGFDRPNIKLAVHRCTTADEQREQVVATARDSPSPGIVYYRTRKATEECAAALIEVGATAAHYHAQVPESPDTYYQELGRAGRDGDPATGELFYRPEDLSLGRFFSSAMPKREDVHRVVGALGSTRRPDRAAVRRDAGIGPRKMDRILNLVEEIPESAEDLTAAVLDRAQAHRALERSRVEMMRRYAETDRCRWQFRPGSGVRHPKFGDGTVMDVERDQLTVLFQDAGYRTLDLRIVQDQRLLTG